MKRKIKERCNRHPLVILMVITIWIASSDPALAQVQPFLSARNPFVWDGVAGRTLLGAKESTVAISGASIINGWYGELSWDIEGLLGSEQNLKAKAPSFLFKLVPVHSISTSHIGSLLALSIGSQALSSVDAFAGVGAYLEDGRFALGLGLNVTWDKVAGGKLSSPSYEWILRTYAQITPHFSIDVATLLHEGEDQIGSDIGLIYELFAPRFHVYVALLDAFSNRMERRVGLSYAVGL